MNRRSTARHALDVDVLLVTAGEDGPVLRSGRSQDVSAGGCTLRLDEDLDVPAPNGVLVVRTAGADMTMLCGPVRTEPGEPRAVGLRFVPATEPNGIWADFVASLAAGE